MATVPTVTTQSVAPGITEAVDVPQTNALFAEKAKTAEAVYGLGRATAGAFNEYGAMVEKIQLEDDDNEAKKLDMEVADYLRIVEHGDGTEANPGYGNLQGEAAVSAYKPTQDAVTKQIKAIRDKASNNRVRDLFDETTGQRALNFQANITDHMVGQRKVSQANTTAARLSQAVNDAGANYGNDKMIQQSLQIGLGELMQQGIREGWTQEVYEDKKREFVTDTIGGAIQGSLAGGGTGRASELLKQFKGDMDSNKVAGYKIQIKNMNEMYAAKADAALHDQVADAITVLGAGKEPAGLAELQKAVKGNKKYEEKLTLAINTRQQVADFSKLSLPEQQATLRAFELKPTATAEEAYTYSKLVTANKEIVNRVKDGEALDIAEENGVIDTKAEINGPQGLDVAGLTTRKQQAAIASDRMQVPVAPLTPSEVKTIGKALPTMDPATATKTLNQLHVGLGDGAYAVAGEMAKSDDKSQKVYAAALVRVGDGKAGIAIAESMMRGRRKLDQNPGSWELSSENTQAPIAAKANSVWASVGGVVPESVVAGANAIYADTVEPGVEFDPEAYDKALIKAQGGQVQYNDVALIPPTPNMSDDEFDTLVSGLSPTDYARFSVGGPPAVGSNGVAFDPRLLQENSMFGMGDAKAVLRQAGVGQYYIEVPGQGFIPNVNGTPYIIDLGAANQYKRRE